MIGRLFKNQCSNNERHTSHAAQLMRYKQIRQVGQALNNSLVESLSRDEILEGARILGFLQRGMLVFDHENELSIVMDFCLHAVRRKGMTPIERYLNTSPPPPDSDEMTMLLALQASRCSMFIVESVERGVGLTVRDALKRERLFLFDVGMGRTAVESLVIASRVIAPDGIVMTTGAALPMGLLPLHKLDDFEREFADAIQASDFWATIIRNWVRSGAASRVDYRSPDAEPTCIQEPHGTLSLERRVGRNDRCPCGSGLKFKRCCGRKQ